MDRKLFLTSILAPIAIWRLVLILLASAAPLFLEYAPTFPYSGSLQQSGLPHWLYSWANFDGVHYLRIIQSGYESTDLIQAFFPTFPLLVKGLVQLLQLPLDIFSITTTAVVLNVLLTCVLAWLMYCLISKDYSQKVAQLCVLALLVFPTSFYFGAVYSEALFLSLVIGSFLAARTNRWWVAAVLAGLASSTRVVGILVLPALLVELWLQHTKTNSLPAVWKQRDRWIAFAITYCTQFWPRIIGLALLASSGLALYMLYLNAVFNDPLYFFHVQSAFGGGRSESLILYPQVLWRSINILFNSTINLRYFTSVLEFVAGFGGLLGLLFALKHVRLSYVFFSLAAFIVPTLTGTFSSMPRYILTSFALFIWIAILLEKQPKLQIVLSIVSGIVLSICTVLFIQGYWIA